MSRRKAQKLIAEIREMLVILRDSRPISEPEDPPCCDACSQPAREILCNGWPAVLCRSCENLQIERIS